MVVEEEEEEVQDLSEYRGEKELGTEVLLDLGQEKSAETAAEENLEGNGNPSVEGRVMGRPRRPEAPKYSVAVG